MTALSVEGNGRENDGGISPMLRYPQRGSPSAVRGHDVTHVVAADGFSVGIKQSLPVCAGLPPATDVWKGPLQALLDAGASYPARPPAPFDQLSLPKCKAFGHPGGLAPFPVCTHCTPVCSPCSITPPQSQSPVLQGGLVCRAYAPPRHDPHPPTFSAKLTHPC